MCQDFSLKPDVEKISCPTLMATGEFDPLSPLEDADAIFNKLNAPKEMWVFEDEFHPIRTPEALSGHSVFHYIAHWMRQAWTEKFLLNMRRGVIFLKMVMVCLANSKIF